MFLCTVTSFVARVATLVELLYGDLGDATRDAVLCALAAVSSMDGTERHLVEGRVVALVCRSMAAVASLASPLHVHTAQSCVEILWNLLEYSQNEAVVEQVRMMPVCY
jgi:hypothetical protein